MKEKFSRKENYSPETIAVTPKSEVLVTQPTTSLPEPATQATTSLSEAATEKTTSLPKAAKQADISLPDFMTVPPSQLDMSLEQEDNLLGIKQPSAPGEASLAIETEQIPALELEDDTQAQIPQVDAPIIARQSLTNILPQDPGANSPVGVVTEQHKELTDRPDKLEPAADFSESVANPSDQAINNIDQSNFDQPIFSPSQPGTAAGYPANTLLDSDRNAAPDPNVSPSAQPNLFPGAPRAVFPGPAIPSAPTVSPGPAIPPDPGIPSGQAILNPPLITGSSTPGTWGIGKTNPTGGAKVKTVKTNKPNIIRRFFYYFLIGPIYLGCEALAILMLFAYLITNFKIAEQILQHYYLACQQRLSSLQSCSGIKQFYIWNYPGCQPLTAADIQAAGQLSQPNQHYLAEVTSQVKTQSLGTLIFNLIAAFFYIPAILYQLQIALLFLFNLINWVNFAFYSSGRHHPAEFLFQFVAQEFLLAIAILIYAAILQVLTRTEVQNAHTVLDLHRSRREIVDAFEIERGRIERDLHDGAQQHLVAASMKVGEAALFLELEVAQPASGDAHQARLRQILGLLKESQDANDQALEALRRTVAGVHPKVLSDHGLAEAVRDICAESPVQTDVKIPYPIPELPSGLSAAAYFLVSEALTNIAKYVPNPAASVLVVAGQDLVISIVDNGPGGAVIRSGGGLAGLQARLEAFGGKLTISSPPGGPTTVRGQLPIILDVTKVSQLQQQV